MGPHATAAITPATPATAQRMAKGAILDGEELPRPSTTETRSSRAGGRKRHYRLSTVGPSSTTTSSKPYGHMPKTTPAKKLHRLSGFLLHSITPRESSILNYTSGVSPGTFTEYDIVVENVRSGRSWMVSRRFSSFRMLRREVQRPFQDPHCHYCAHVLDELAQLEPQFPSKRLWGSTRPAVVKSRAERFQLYLQGLLDIVTRPYLLNCRLVSNGLAVAVRNFLTTDAVRYKGIPGEFGQQIPCLLRQLSGPRSASKNKRTLTTILEGFSPRSSASNASAFEDDLGPPSATRPQAIQEHDEDMGEPEWPSEALQPQQQQQQQHIEAQSTGRLRQMLSR